MGVNFAPSFAPGAAELADAILFGALQVGASDIHLNPAEDELRVFYRIHGRVVDVSTVTGWAGRVPKAVAQRIKVQAKMQLGDQRRPQDGQLRLSSSAYGGAADLRVATIPTVQGERLAIRVIPAEGRWDRLEDSGLSYTQLANLREALRRGGMGVVLGRVGAGKSTTLHAILRERSVAGATVVTIEDPVERKVAAYQQIEVDDRAGLTFAVALRAALRQDPDVLMVGEIRDRETAEIAVRAGLTGHLVLTTMHANRVEQAAARFLELGVDARFVHEAMRFAIWQELAEIGCPDCRGTGCLQCGGVGLLGRRAVFDVAVFTGDAPDSTVDTTVVRQSRAALREVSCIRAAAGKRQGARVTLGRSRGTGRIRRRS